MSIILQKDTTLGILYKLLWIKWCFLWVTHVHVPVYTYIHLHVSHDYCVRCVSCCRGKPTLFEFMPTTWRDLALPRWPRPTLPCRPAGMTSTAPSLATMGPRTACRSSPHSSTICFPLFLLVSLIILQWNLCILWAHLGPREMSWLKRCPYFRGSFV